ncbi:MAG: hypothetical protein IPK22_14310 [Verrucomicrobiaceae bacterium]|nr:hypothetical protein [Verrucomicrobiaceae bacterium]
MLRPLLDRLRRLKHKLARSAIRRVQEIYDFLIGNQLRAKEQFNTVEHAILLLPEFSHLDPNLSYFVMHASFGDKWCILSYLASHFDIYPSSRVIAAKADLPIIEAFFEEQMVINRFIFVDSNALNKLSAYFRPTRRSTSQLADHYFNGECGLAIAPYFVKHGLPAGTIRHLHLVQYPYFGDLYMLRAVTYGTLLKTLLYLPNSVKPNQPTYYTDADLQSAHDISSVQNLPTTGEDLLPAVLFNVVNFSHASLSLDQINLIVAILESSGYRTLLNVAQHPQQADIEAIVGSHPNAVVVAIPPKLLAIVGDHVASVIGVLGGAMNVAVQFGHSHVLSLQTPGIRFGCSEDELYAGKGKENMWQWVNEDWPCLYPGRIVENRYIGDPSIIQNEELVAVITAFLERTKVSFYKPNASITSKGVVRW